MNYNELTFLAKEKKITMSQLANDIGMTLTGFRTSIEARKLPWEKMDILCKILDITPNELMDWSSVSAGVYAANIHGNNTQNSTEAIAIIAAQLDKKDREIDRLLKIIERIKS